jgi:hypothetical protein
LPQCAACPRRRRKRASPTKAAATQLVQMNSDAVSNFNIQGTPSFADQWQDGG